MPSKEFRCFKAFKTKLLVRGGEPIEPGLLGGGVLPLNWVSMDTSCERQIPALSRMSTMNRIVSR